MLAEKSGTPKWIGPVSSMSGLPFLMTTEMRNEEAAGFGEATAPKANSEKSLPRRSHHYPLFHCKLHSQFKIAV